ncbi:hypothetical protein [Sphingorhabdus sp.]|uniref:hypothetical protein n=1 Tax=Sphingorhabdus sp. TaxID=1902408 RepID=UPI00359395BB
MRLHGLASTLSIAGVLLAHPVQAADDTQRSAKQEKKRLAAIAKLTPSQIAGTASIKDDPLEPLVTITTEAAFRWKGGFTDPVRADNMLRAILDRPTVTANYQLYQTITYSGNWRRYDRANIAFPSGLKTIALTVIDRRVVTCAYGPCVLEETVGFNLSEDDIDALAASYEQNPKATLKFRFKSATSFDWNDDLPAVEVVGLLQAVEKWKRSKGLVTP